jgi:nucleotide-binding universal stress UspA family protein
MRAKKFKKVLIALDYDPTAKKVAETGFMMAKAMGAEVILLHVVADPVYYSTAEFSPIMGFSGYTDFGPMQAEATDVLNTASNHFLDKSKHHLGDDTIQTIVVDGDFAESILSTAKKTHADIIVMGSHSRKWLENIVMGSVTEKVLHQTSIPLFIVPTRQKI